MSVEQALSVYLSRQSRTAHPAGKFDRAGRWYPAETEQCNCCRGIRTPSRAWPYSLMTHCRSAEHVANLCGVDAKSLRKAAREAAKVAA